MGKKHCNNTYTKCSQTSVGIMLANALCKIKLFKQPIYALHLI